MAIYIRCIMNLSQLENDKQMTSDMDVYIVYSVKILSTSTLDFLIHHPLRKKKMVIILMPRFHIHVGFSSMTMIVLQSLVEVRVISQSKMIKMTSSSCKTIILLQSFIPPISSSVNDSIVAIGCRTWNKYLHEKSTICDNIPGWFHPRSSKNWLRFGFYFRILTFDFSIVSVSSKLPFTIKTI